MHVFRIEISNIGRATGMAEISPSVFKKERRLTLCGFDFLESIILFCFVVFVKCSVSIWYKSW